MKGSTDKNIQSKIFHLECWFFLVPFFEVCKSAIAFEKYKAYVTINDSNMYPYSMVVQVEYLQWSFGQNIQVNNVQYLFFLVSSHMKISFRNTFQAVDHITLLHEDLLFLLVSLFFYVSFQKIHIRHFNII